MKYKVGNKVKLKGPRYWDNKDRNLNSKIGQIVDITRFNYYVKIVGSSDIAVVDDEWISHQIIINCPEYFNEI